MTGASSVYRKLVDVALSTERRRMAILAAVPAAWIVVMHLGPLVQMLRISLLAEYPLTVGRPAEISFAHYSAFFTEGIYRIPYLRTLVFSATVTLTTLLVVYPIAYILAKRVPKAWQVRYLLLLLAPFWAGDVIRTFAFIVVLGNKGALNTALIWLGLVDEPISFLYSYYSLVAGMIYLVVLYMLLPLYAAIEKIPDQLLEAAADLGAGPLTRLFRIVVPLSKDGIVSGCTLVFLMCTGAYVGPLLLGGPNTTLFSETIGTFFHIAGDRWPTGAAFSIIMLVSALAIVGLFTRVVRGAK